MSMNVKTSVLVCSVLLLTACGNDPVPISQCDAVVKHAQRILKDKAPNKRVLDAQCQKATDKTRGCIMAADKPMKILQCS